MTDLQTAAQMALDALVSFTTGTNGLYEGEFAEEIAALRAALAVDLEDNCLFVGNEAAAELRRLDALNAELVEALEDFSSYVRDEQCSTDGPVTYSNTQIHKLVFKARAVLAKAKEQT